MASHNRKRVKKRIPARNDGPIDYPANRNKGIKLQPWERKFLQDLDIEVEPPPRRSPLLHRIQSYLKQRISAWFTNKRKP